MSAAGEAGAAANHEAFPYAVSLDGSPPSVERLARVTRALQ
jgi:hypothetical protein